MVCVLPGQSSSEKKGGCQCVLPLFPGHHTMSLGAAALVLPQSPGSSVMKASPGQKKAVLRHRGTQVPRLRASTLGLPPLLWVSTAAHCGLEGDFGNR